MKRFKRMIALMCAMVMMLAMSTVAFAEEATTGASITVKGLAQNDVETVSIYKIATASHDGDWTFEDWAASYVHNPIEPDKEYTFDWDDMKTAVIAEGSAIVATAETTCAAGSSTVTFTGLDGAAYLVIAKGGKTTYAVMGAKTYEYVDGRYTLTSATVYAKTSDVPTKKEADDQFVHNGEKVTFTITTVLPAAKTLDENNHEVDNQFYVYDKPEKLTGLALKSVMIGGADVTDGIILENTTSNTINGETGVYTIDLTSLLEANEGKTVVLTLTAIVDGDQGYTNSAWNNKTKFDTDTGKPENPGKVVGYTADITITKYDDTLTFAADGKVTGGKTLTGAKFQIKKGNEDGNEGEALRFTKTTDGQYIYDENGTVSDVEVDENGAVKVSGLDEGTYNIYETEAPKGYSVIKDIAGTVTVDATDATANISLKSDISDTKLSSLPFTGGMGTTLFTVFGVIIMAAAAGLFFANKKKSAK